MRKVMAILREDYKEQLDGEAVSVLVRGKLA